MDNSDIIELEQSQLAVKAMINQWLPRSLAEPEPEERQQPELYTNQTKSKIQKNTIVSTKKEELIETKAETVTRERKKPAKFVNKYF